MIPALAFAPPDVTQDAIIEALRELYGLSGTLTRVHGERDLNHRLTLADGRDYFVRVGTLSEPAARAEMQAAALLHVAAIDPDCPLPRLVPTKDGQMLGSLAGCPVMVLTWRPGAVVAMPGDLLAEEMGRAIGRLSRALGSFFHSAAGEFVVWDVRRRMALTPDIKDHLSPEVTRLIGPVLDWARDNLPDALTGCHHQIIHGDSHLSNLLCTDCKVTGIIDFGDMMFGPVVQNLATTIASLQRAGAPKHIEAAVLRGHQTTNPLSQKELALLPELVRFRHATALAFYDAMVSAKLSQPAYAGRVRAQLLDLLPALLGTKSKKRPVHDLSLLDRRHRVMDPHRHLFYSQPPELVRGSGVHLFDASSGAYLDIYNNVASLGHNHPKVVEAIVAQSRRHNLNTRYLDETVVSYAEELTATFPDGLDAAIFTCTGSEANDLALRICRQLTGNQGVISIDTGYHGNTDLLRKLKSGVDPALATVSVPMTPADLDAISDACRALRASGAGVAALIVDSIFVSSGLVIPEKGILAEAARIVRQAGGLLICDEVQSGFHRTGANIWGYALHGLAPDLVTLGKPMANGYPMGAVIYGSAMQPVLQKGIRYFNTFAGNPVAAAAGRAVLQVLHEEDIGLHVARMHSLVRDGLTNLGFTPSGTGLAWSVPLGSAASAEAVVNHLLTHNILAGTAGPAQDRLRIRPPLIFGEEAAKQLFAALDTAPR